MTATTDPSRLPNTTTNLPIAYGSISFYLGPQSDEYHTHKWTLYLRSPDPNFDLGQAISKVVFQLHPSFSVPTRELTEPPFEVIESGWGEFEASMRIIWRDVAEERSTILTHGIKLYPNRSASATDPSSYMNTTVPVVSEKYDEVVFTNPKLEFHKLLLAGNANKPLPYPLSNEPSNLEYFRTYGNEEDVQRMLAAKKFLEGELSNIKDRLLKADQELDEIKTSLTLAKEAGGSGENPKASGTTAVAKASESKPKSKKSKASSSGENVAAKKAKTDAVNSSSEQTVAKKTKLEPVKNKTDMTKSKTEPPATNRS